MSTRGPGRALAILTSLMLMLSACSATQTPSTEPTFATVSAAPSAEASPSAEATVCECTGTPTAEPSATEPPTPPPTATPAATPGPTPRPTPAPTPAPPAGFDPNHVSVTLKKVATAPGRPLAIANAGDGSYRLFVAGQDGVVSVIAANGQVLGTPFLDIAGQVSDGGEQGLLGLAFHPDFPTDPRVFVYYTDNGGDIVVSSFDVNPGAPNVAVGGSEQVVITVEHSEFGNHNGGGLLFGPDGYLYMATGDGGGGGDPYGSGQDENTLLGKILRIDVDGGDPYAIPPGNPFAGGGGAPEAWLTGLRNPFRFSFDRSNGDLWIGDVGQGAWEEVDVARAGVGGLNYGWNIMEGAHCYQPSTGCPTGGLTLPVAEYGHDLGVAVIGGYVYRGPQAILRGGYFFSDNYSGRIWAFAAAGNGAKTRVQVGQGAVGVAGYGETEDGELYAADLDGNVYRVVGTAR